MTQPAKGKIPKSQLAPKPAPKPNPPVNQGARRKLYWRK
jgi:hypothetical protein